MSGKTSVLLFGWLVAAGCTALEPVPHELDGTGHAARVLNAADGDECAAGAGACTLAECTDATDNGFGAGVDGLTDCDDEDCAAFCTDTDTDGFCEVGRETGTIDGLCDNNDINLADADCLEGNINVNPDAGPEDTFALCNDTFDNDCLGGADAADANCVPFDGTETGTADCNDGLDNDGDNDVDADDADCVENTFALCNDGEDNDGDGDVDGDDADCAPFDGTETGTADCNDGFDNDGDNDVDSDDADCVENTFPLCNDTEDNDGDGDVDAADADCAPFAGVETGTALCNDGIDNDGDSDIDADDADCVENTFALCNDTEDNDGDGDTDAADADCAPFDGTETGTADCNDGFDNDGDNDVDADDADCVENTFPLCNDTEDNDGDGDVDGADADCVPFDGTETGTADCNDGLDNDGDNDVDADDADCVENSFALCTDNQDNDGDGDTDEDDADCTPFVGGENTFAACGDGLDNDGDTLIDDLDPDCAPFIDNDGDGFCESGNCIDGSTGGDCNDATPNEAPNNDEDTFALCSDFFDNDCDGDENGADSECQPFVDNDGDGYCERANCLGGLPGNDCNDGAPEESPGGAENTFARCSDGFDNDCDTLENGDDQDCDPFEDNDNDGQCESGNCIDGSDPGDCDDTQPTMFDRAAEPIPLCIDGLDNDCDGNADIADNDCANVRDIDNDGYCPNGVDNDGDGFCTEVGEPNPTNFDCAEGNNAINPGADETVSDGVDQNCDNVDACWQDADNDNFGINVVVDGLSLDCDADANRAPERAIVDCNDGVSSIFPGANETVADGIDQNCDSVDNCYRDDDNDGRGTSNVRTGLSLDCDADPNRSSFSDDCDDNDGLNFPGNPEICDGQDNDCQNGDDFGGFAISETDNDGDGTSECNGDCDDGNPQRNLGNTEIPANNLDEDCDQRELCYRDADTDGFGNDGGATQNSAPNQGAWACSASGLSAVADDCNDADPAINTSADEQVANGVDQDCDGNELCWRDSDNDQHGREPGANQATIVSPNLSCTDSGESELSDDCDDSVPTIFLGAAEVLNDGVDQDCDGFDSVRCYFDGDGDGFGVSTALVDSMNGNCTFPGASDVNTDCVDTDSAIFPGAADACDDGIDQDCSGGLPPDGPDGPDEIDDDGDGLSFQYEQSIGTTDCDADSDGDSLSDLVEDDNGSDPTDTDTDGDGVPDNQEFTGGANPAPLNTDGDFLNDFEDPDDDGDGVDTIIEAPLGNTDGTDQPDYLDTDDDNDGIDTIIEGGPSVDTDGNSVPNYRDPDDDGDGIDTSVEEQFGNGRGVDFDGDGLDGHLDPDSDADGVDDGEEWGGNGANAPRNSDGAAGPDIQDVDDDGDSIPTLTEGNETVDTDGDLTPDYLDLDSDEDGIGDGPEAATGCMDFQNADTDGDGAPDGEEYGQDVTARNTDSENGSPNPDTLINPCDDDDDGDTIPSVAEVGIDTDGDGVQDHLDSDDDEDGVATWDEDEDESGAALDDDTDLDGIPNARDDDDDGDGIQTIYEELFSTNRLNTDTDGDSVEDNIEWGCPFGTYDPLTCRSSENQNIQYGPMQPRNTDFEFDADNDGVADGAWGCESAATPGGAPDPSDPNDWNTSLGNDDGLIDARDPDDDNDSIPTGFGSSGALGEGGAGQDSDLDGIPDYRDMDSDNDSFEQLPGVAIPNGFRPDACELGLAFPEPAHDVDSDTIPNWVDFNDFDATEGDPDGDRLSTALEILLGLEPARPDSDGDGVLDCYEVGVACPPDPGPAAPYQENTLPVDPLDTDGDGIIDAADDDDDDDGISSQTEVFYLVDTNGTLIENRFCPVPFETERPVAVWVPDSGVHEFRCPEDPTPIVIAPDETDRDGDGIPNRLDADDDNDNVPTSAEDPNGNLDWFDDDSDGDVVVDYLDTNDWDGPIADPDFDGFTNADEELICESLGLSSAECDDLKFEDDFDDDGIPDNLEVGSDPSNPLDSDGDGIPDIADDDDDNDCIPSAVEGLADLDGDGFGAYNDTDSDGDGVDDMLEWFGSTISNCPETLPDAPDTDCDGLIDPWDSNDADFNGPNAQECLDGEGPPPDKGVCGCNSASPLSAMGMMLGLVMLLGRRRREAA